MIYIKGAGYIDQRGVKVCSKRKMDLQLASSYGRSGDTASFTRLIIESRAGRQALTAAYTQGQKQQP